MFKCISYCGCLINVGFIVLLHTFPFSVFLLWDIPVTDFSFLANRASQYFKHDWILLVSLAVFLLFLWMSPKYLHTHLIATEWTVSTLLTCLSVLWVTIACLSSSASFSSSVLASADYNNGGCCILLPCNPGFYWGKNHFYPGPGEAIQWPFLLGSAMSVLGETRSSGQLSPPCARVASCCGNWLSSTIPEMLSFSWYLVKAARPVPVGVPVDSSCLA